MKTQRNSWEESFQRMISTIYHKGIYIIIWLIIWYLISVFVDNEIILVSPVRAVVNLGKLLIQEKFWLAVLGSAVRICVGFVVAVVLAFLFAGLSHASRLFEEFLNPLITVLKSVPVASFVVILLIWWGSGVLSAIISMLIVFPNVYINTLAGLKSVDKKLLEMSKVFGISARDKFLYIYRPQIKSYVVSALELSLGMCWKSGIAAEVIGSPANSIGGKLYLAKVYMDCGDIFAWTTVVVVLSIIFQKVFMKLAGYCFDKEWMPAYKGHASQEEITSLHIKNLTKNYDNKTVIDNLTKEFSKGQINYLKSPSGSGKTTLLHIICGIVKPDSGEVVEKPSVSICFQDDRLLENYDACINLGLVTNNKEDALNRLTELIGAEARVKKVNEYSGGMKRALSLVRAMENNSQLVILDEPFNGMDENMRQQAKKYIEEKGKNRIVILASHI